MRNMLHLRDQHQTMHLMELISSSKYNIYRGKMANNLRKFEKDFTCF